MATILCVTSAVPGVLFAGVELARRLDRAGHRVAYASFAEADQTVSSNGLDFLPLAASRYESFLAEDARLSLIDRWCHLSSRRQQALDSLAVSSLVQSVRRLTPDLILIDGELHEHIIAVFGCGVPIALLNSFVSIWRQPGLPPPHHLVRPGVSWKGTGIGIWLLWQSLRLAKWRRAWTHKVRRVGCDRLSLLHLLARDSGFDFRRETDDRQWLMPFTYRRLPVLSLHALEFEFPHRPPAMVDYVGPMLLETRSDGRITDAVRAELAAIFDRLHGGKRRLIYAGFGSFFSTDLGFLRRLLDAVAVRSDWDVVISLGGRVSPSDLGPLPEHVHAFDWLPQLEVLRHADVAVTHGGINTIDECVLFGVPMVVYCGFETDMAGNTSRIVHHKIGIAGDQHQDSPRVIREHIDRLLHEPRFKSNVQRLQAHYAAYEDERVAEQTVDSLLGRARSRTRP